MAGEVVWKANATECANAAYPRAASPPGVHLDRTAGGDRHHTDYEFYDDLLQLDQSKHMTVRKDARGNGGGGSNYAFVDGSTRFLKFGKAFNPINLWAIRLEARNTGIGL